MTVLLEHLLVTADQHGDVAFRGLVDSAGDGTLEHVDTGRRRTASPVAASRCDRWCCCRSTYRRRARPARIPVGPQTTASTTAGDGKHVNTTVDRAATSAAESAHVAPTAISRSASGAMQIGDRDLMAGAQQAHRQVRPEVAESDVSDSFAHGHILGERKFPGKRHSVQSTSSQAPDEVRPRRGCQTRARRSSRGELRALAKQCYEPAEVW